MDPANLNRFLSESIQRPFKRLPLGKPSDSVNDVIVPVKSHHAILLAMTDAFFDGMIDGMIDETTGGMTGEILVGRSLVTLPCGKVRS